MDLEDYKTQPDEYEEMERDAILEIINNEIKQWEDYHVLKALERVRTLIEQREPQYG